jgi:predicted RNA-binding Zn-ribbon protein involved in translation (DUF1610 family)
MPAQRRGAREAVGRLKAEETQADIARTYGVDPTTIGRLDFRPLRRLSTSYVCSRCQSERHLLNMSSSASDPDRTLHAAKWSRSLLRRQKIVAIWNARQAGGRAVVLSNDWRCNRAAGLPWLSFSCPACGQFGTLDLGTSISSLIPSVSCRRCSPSAPLARLEMLTAERPLALLAKLLLVGHTRA